MKKKMIISLLALTVLIGVAGTLSYTRSSQLAAQERAAKEMKKDALVAVSIKNKDTEPPKIEGQKDWNVTLGDKIDVLTGVSAKDNTDDSIKVMASNFSTEKTGDQKVTLTAEDHEHNKASKTITVHVKAPEPKAAPVAAVVAEPETVPVDNQPVVEAPAEVAAPEPTPVVEAPAVVQPVAAPAEPTWTPNTMYVGGIAISYQNAGQGSGQSVIDNNPNVIATWGGNAVQSGNDGANTHFIGHNPGIFGVLFSLGGGSQITVTDAAGTPTYYTVNQIFQVDDYATGVADGQSYADQIIGSGGGERITLQTCVNDDINLIVMASAA